MHAYQVSCAPSSPHHCFDPLPSSLSHTPQPLLPSPPTSPPSPRRRKRICSPILTSLSLSPLRLGSIDEDPEYDFGYSLDLGSESPASASTHDLVSSSDVLREWAGAGIAVPRVPARRRSWRSSSFSRDRIRKIVVNEADRDCAICFEYAVKPRRTTCCGKMFCLEHLKDWLQGPNGTGRCPHCESPCSLENNTISLASPTEKKRKQVPSPLLLIRPLSNDTVPVGDSATEASTSRGNEASPSRRNEASTSRGRSPSVRHQDSKEEEASGSDGRPDSPSSITAPTLSPLLFESIKPSSSSSIPTPPNSSVTPSRDSSVPGSLLPLSSDTLFSQNMFKHGKPHRPMYLTQSPGKAGPISSGKAGPISSGKAGPISARPISSTTPSPALTAASSQTSIDTLPSPAGLGANAQGSLSHIATVVAFVLLLYTLTAPVMG